MLKQQILVGVVLACFGLFATAAEPKAVSSAGAASAVPTGAASVPDTDEIRKRNEERLRKATEQERKAKAEREKRESQCQFKAVMTDADIANCRQAYR